MRGTDRYYNLGNIVKYDFTATLSNGSSKYIIERANLLKNRFEQLVEEDGQRNLNLSTCLKFIHLNLVVQILDSIINMHTTAASKIKNKFFNSIKLNPRNF